MNHRYLFSAVGCTVLLSLSAHVAGQEKAATPELCKRTPPKIGPGGETMHPSRAVPLPYEDEINTILMNSDEYRGKSRLTDKFRDTLRTKIRDTKLQIDGHFCRLTAQAKLYGADKIFPAEIVAKDPKCRSEGTYNHKQPGSGLVNEHGIIKEKYANLSALIDCHNKLMSALDDGPPEKLPEYQIKFYESLNGKPEGTYRISERKKDKTITCKSNANLDLSDGHDPKLLVDDHGVKVSPGLACLLHKDAFWDGESEVLTIPGLGQRAAPGVNGEIQNGGQLLRDAISHGLPR